MRQAHSAPPLVLLADDFVDARDMYCAFLEFAGFRVVVAGTGFEAISVAKARRPDVVLMDFMMPELNGLEATALLKADPDLQHIPVLMLTAHARQQDRDAAFAVGCSGFLTKPCLPEALEQAVRQALPKP